jgi:nanoRNase/pAp phosphatase (c-di-AMP/oligoRNAs hydrolase)
VGDKLATQNELLMVQSRLTTLFEAMSSSNRALILPHNDPDPDAIASAVALRHLLEQRSVAQADIAYKGIIGRVENKGLVRYLDHPLRRLTSADLRQPVAIALVDTQPGTGNNALPPQITAAAVIDHHPWREGTAAAAFADVRSDLGATSTILTEYLQAAALEPPPPLATALFYGIKSDTMGLGRGASQSDAAAYFYLQPRIDVDSLVEIERAQVPPEYFKSLTATLQAARRYDNVVISYVGQIGYPDLAAEMADLLLRLEGTRWVVCMGVYQDSLILAARTRSRRGGAGQLVRAMVGARGMAGGHGTMAGGQVQLQGEDPTQLAREFSQRALQFLQIPPEIVGMPII